MPMPKGEARDPLSLSVTYFLAHGALPPPSNVRRPGLVMAFELKHRWLDRLRQPAVVDELRSLWSRHQQEIELAAAGGEPWVVRALASPDSTDKDEDDEEDTE
jgi:hypothetical protein